MRTILLLALLWVSSANGMTNPIFSQDGSKATFVLLGMPGDPDPVGLWNALAIPPEDFQGKLAKRLEVLAPDGSKGFNIACVFSKTIEGNGSCTVILNKAPGMIDIGGGKARMWVSGNAAVQLAKAFQMRDESTILFRSQNGRLSFTVARDRGVVTDFVVDWR